MFSSKDLLSNRLRSVQHTVAIFCLWDISQSPFPSNEQEFLNENAGYFTHHTVKKGDNLSKIATKYKTTVAKIKSLNVLQSNIIYPGQKLKLFGQAQKNNFHIVKRGETLSNIASKYKITVAKLKKINNLKSDVIYPGDKLHY